MDLNALKEFCTIASEGSFAGAARKLNTPKSTVSKRIQDLENALGVRLIERTTRKLHLTAEGELVLARAERILSDADEIQHALADTEDNPRGHLRIAAPIVFGQSFLGQVVAVCRRLYPDMTLEIVMTDSQPDLVEEGFDGAIRIGTQSNSQFMQRHLATAHSVVVASPEVVANKVSSPSELALLPAILFGTGLIQTWHFTNGSSETSVRLAGAVAMTSLVALRGAVLGGAGIAQLPLYLVEDDIAAGRLHNILEGWTSLPSEIVFVYPNAQSLTLRLRAFIDVLSSAFPDKTLHGGILTGLR